jgi:hypothetical protein
VSPARLGSRRDEQFARLLDGTTPATAVSPAMASMAGLAGALRAAGAAAPAGPDADFRAALRQRLVAVATVQAADPVVSGIDVPSRPRVVLGARARRGLAALVGTAAIATSVTGVAVAASRSLPGDPFYGVKKSTEAVQLWAAHGNLAKGKRHLEFARTRLAEARALPPTSSHLTSTLSAMNSQTTQGAAELVAAAKSSDSTAPLTVLATFSQQQYTGLSQLASTLPPAARAPEAAAVTLLTTVIKQVQTVAHGRCVLCRVSGGSPLTSTSPAPSAAGPSPAHTPGAGGTPARHHPSARVTIPGLLSPSARSSATTKTGTGTTPKPTPTHTKLLPLPTITLPPNPVTSILNPPHPTKKPKPLLTPLPGLSSVLGGIGL